MNRIALILIGVLIMACSGEPPLKSTFVDSNGEPMTISDSLAGNKGAVLLFLSPECPLCQNYSVAINEIRTNYSQKAIPFIGIISGNYYTAEEVNLFKAKYDLDMDIIFDSKFTISKFYNATTTPEAILIDEDGKLLYRGAIDNWAISLGKKRLEATEYYLISALDAFLSGTKINPKETKPVGCFIE